MLRNKLKGALLALSALLVVGGAVFAQETKTPGADVTAPQGRKEAKRGGSGAFNRRGQLGRQGRRGRQGLGRLARQLNLTDAQREQMRSVAQNNRAQDGALRNEARQLRQQKRAGTLDANGTARLEQLRGQFKATRAARRNERLAHLTPEQKAQVAQFKERHTLGLSDAQKEQMKSLRQRFQHQNSGSRAEARKLMQQKRAGTLDANGQARLEQLRAQGQAARATQRNEFLNLLTPEQKAKFEQRKHNRRGGHRRLQ
jgi:protein CpxP